MDIPPNRSTAWDKPFQNHSIQRPQINSFILISSIFSYVYSSSNAFSFFTFRPYWSVFSYHIVESFMYSVIISISRSTSMNGWIEIPLSIILRLPSLNLVQKEVHPYEDDRSLHRMICICNTHYLIMFISLEQHCQFQVIKLDSYAFSFPFPLYWVHALEGKSYNVLMCLNAFPFLHSSSLFLFCVSPPILRYVIPNFI